MHWDPDTHWLSKAILEALSKRIRNREKWNGYGSSKAKCRVISNTAVDRQGRGLNSPGQTYPHTNAQRQNCFMNPNVGNWGGGVIRLTMRRTWLMSDDHWRHQQWTPVGHPTRHVAVGREHTATTIASVAWELLTVVTVTSTTASVPSLL